MITPVNYAVETNDVTITRGQTPILRGVSCAIRPGTCAAILGPNGSGKTTFTRTLTGQMFVTSGAVTVLGETIGRTDIRKLRQRIGIVNPTAGYAGMSTVDDELSARDAVLTGYFGTIGLYDQVTVEQHDHADHVLAQVGLSHRRDLRFSLLSSGEQRRCLIARALVHRPELLILDEPTGGMDVAGREHVLATIDQIMQQPDPPTVLFITHHVEELPPRTDHVMLMRDGMITAAGRPDQIITPEHLTQLYGCKVYVRQHHGRFWLEVLPEAWLDLIQGEDTKR
jgi:iron complex transport system ATP-binding protein